MNQVCSLEKRDKHGEDQDEHNQVHDRRRGWTSRRWRGSKWTQSWPWLDAQQKKMVEQEKMERIKMNMIKCTTRNTSG